MALIGGAFVTVATDPRRGSVWEWLGVRVWSSRVGRVLFHLAARGRAAGNGVTTETSTALAIATLGPSTGSVATHRTPLAVFDSLPRARRAELRGLRDAIAHLEAEAAQGVTRESELDSALAEARAGDATCVEDARRRVLVEDLARARRDAATRRAELATQMEHVRVQLLRVRSGLAGRAELAGEIGAEVV